MSSKNGRKFMDAVTYTGNGGTQSITGLDFSPDLVWIKRRNGDNPHSLMDTVRGTGVDLDSSTNEVEDTTTTTITSFDSNGFTLGSRAGTNGADQSFVAWAWDAGSDFTPTVSGFTSASGKRNIEAGFSIVKVTGNNVVSSFDHGLGVAPALIISKNLDNAYDWGVYHQSVGSAPTTKFLKLNEYDAVTNKGDDIYRVVDSSSIEVDSWPETASNGDYVYYIWSEVPGYSKAGKYTGNGSTTSNFVYTGFKPRWILVKNSSNAAGYNWFIVDSERTPNNPIDDVILPNENYAEDIGNPGYEISFLSNGFNVTANNAVANGSGDTYIYMAFADKPTFTPQETTLTFEGSKDLETIDVGSVVYQGGVASTVKSKNAATNQLTFAGSHNFQEDSPVNSDVNGSGIISSIDIATNRMTLTDVVGSFAPNKGRSVIGSVRRLPKYQSETSRLIGAVDAGVEYEVEQSLIFNGTNSYLSRTQTASDDPKKWTYSVWVKRVDTATSQGILERVYTDNSASDGVLELWFGGEYLVMTDYSYYYINTGSIFLFTDTSRWYHLVVSVDTTLSNATDRVKLYVDGVQYATGGTSTLTQNSNTAINSGSGPLNMGVWRGDSYNSTCMADAQFVDGVAHDANAFGYFDAYGFWNAKDYTDPKALDTITTATDSQLTLASNTNFNKLAVGKTIKQDSGYTAETSAITNVVVNEYGAGSTTPTVSGMYMINVDKMFDGNLDVAADGMRVGGTNATQNTVTMTLGTPIPFSTLEVRARTPGVSSANITARYSDNSTEVILGGQQTSLQWVTASTTNKSLVGFDFVYSNVNASAAITGIRVDGELLLDHTALTLTDDTDLANFRVGDEVSGTLDTKQVAITTVDAYAIYSDAAVNITSQTNTPETWMNSMITQSYWNSNINDPNKQGNKGSYLDAGNETLTFSYSGFTVGDTIDVVVGSPSTNSQATSATISGDVQETGNFNTTDGLGKNELPKTALTLTVTQTSGTITFNAAVGNLMFHYIQYLAVPAKGTVTNINNSAPYGITLSPTNTVSWVGSSNASANLSAGFGTVTAFDSTTNTINYTLDSGRFIGGESKVANALTNSYGTNGFRLPFTPGDLGKDSFGSNDWTPNNFESDASVVDSPTNYGTDTGVGNEVRGNYCILDALLPAIPMQATATLSNGNLTGSSANGNFGGGFSNFVIEPNTGKWYWEVNCDSNLLILGVQNASITPTGAVGTSAGSYTYEANTGNKKSAGSSATYGAGAPAGTVIGVAYDSDAGSIAFYLDGVSQGVAYTGITSPVRASFGENTTGGGSSVITYNVNFGQKVFTHAAPADHKTLNTHNL